MKITESSTRVTKLKGNIPVYTYAQRPKNEGPSGLQDGMWMFNTTTKSLDIYYNGEWYGHPMSTTTSTSTSTTTTSTSTTTS